MVIGYTRDPTQPVALQVWVKCRLQHCEQADAKCLSDAIRHRYMAARCAAADPLCPTWIAGPHVECVTSCHVHSCLAVSSVLCGVVLWITKLQPVPRVSGKLVKALLPVALFHTVGHVAACVSFSLMAISFSHIVKSTEPVPSLSRQSAGAHGILHASDTTDDLACFCRSFRWR